MSRIGSVGSIGSAQLAILNQLTQIGNAIDQNNQRLSTLKNINSAKDDPSGLVHAQLLTSSLNAVQTAQSGLVRAQGFVDTADTAAQNIVSQLQAAKTLALQAAGGTLNSSEIAANQTQLNDILDSIDRLSQTDYNGTRLLDGTSGYTASGVNSSQISHVQVQSKSTDSDVNVSVNVTTTALQATKAYAGGTLSGAATLLVAGPNGTTTINLADGATTQDITDAFNSVTYLTGIAATKVDGTNVTFNTSAYGSAATISITPQSGSFTTTGSGVGRDAVATINGTSVTADGTTFNYAGGNLNARIDIAPTASGALTTFTVSGTGLKLNISSNSTDLARIGLPDLSTSSLGGTSGKLSSLRSGQGNALTDGQANTAMDIIDQALSQATEAEAHIGGFSKYVLDTASSTLSSQSEQLSKAYDSIMNVDVAAETAQLSRNQLLQQTALQAMQVSVLNNTNVLSLLQSAVVRLA